MQDRAQGSRPRIGKRSEAERTRLARRVVVVAVGGRPVTPVEDVLDVELDLPGLVQLRIKPRIDADEAGQSYGVVRGSKGIREIDHAERRRPGRIDLVFVPQRELIVGNQLHTVAGDDYRR